MTPKEKAEELCNRFSNAIFMLTLNASWDETYRKCASIVLDEVIPLIESYEEASSAPQQADNLEWWKEVKQEIQKVD